MVRLKAPKPPPSVDPAAPARNTRSRARARPAEPPAPVYILQGDDDSDPRTPEQPKRATRGTHPTPLVYLDGDMPRRRATRLRAISVAFHQDFCEISHFPNSCAAVKGCHCLPHSWMGDNSKKLMRALEYQFGFRYSKSLNLDTRWNIFLLKSDYHDYLDGNGLFFLPLLRILNRIEEWARKNSDLPLGKKILFTTALPMPPDGWPYMLVNLNLPHSHVIVRKVLESIVEDSKTRWKDTINSATYGHPFTDFPIIHSHVHPCYVSLNAWDKLKNIRAYPTHWLPEQKKCARLVTTIAELCISQTPPENFKPNPKITASMRRLRVTQQVRAARDSEEQAESDDESSTPPPEQAPIALGEPPVARTENGEDAPESSGSEQSTPSRKRPVAGPSRLPADRPTKRPRRNAGPSRG